MRIIERKNRASWTSRAAALADGDGRSARHDRIARRPRLGGLLLLLLAAAFAATSCTGSQTTRTPVVVFVAGQDLDSEAWAVRSFRSSLAGDSGADTEAIVELDAFRRAVPGEVIAMEAVQGDDPALFVLLRDADGSDLLARFDLRDLSFVEPDSLAPFPDAFPENPLDLDTLVTAFDAFNDEDLCATGMSIASDGSWVGVLHDPQACGVTGSPAIVAVELDPSEGEARRVGPPGVSGSDLAVSPQFLGLDDDLRLVWLRAQDGVVAWSPNAADDLPGPVSPLDVGTSEPVLGRSGSGVAVASQREVQFVSVANEAPGPVWTADEVGEARSIVASDALPGPSVILVGSERLAVIFDLDDEPDDDVISYTPVPDGANAALGPYGFLFVASTSGLRAYDPVSTQPGASLVPAASGSIDLSGFAPTSISWAFSSDEGAIP